MRVCTAREMLAILILTQSRATVSRATSFLLAEWTRAQFGIMSSIDFSAFSRVFSTRLYPPHLFLFLSSTSLSLSPCLTYYHDWNDMPAALPIIDFIRRMSFFLFNRQALPLFSRVFVLWFLFKFVCNTLKKKKILFVIGPHFYRPIVRPQMKGKFIISSIRASLCEKPRVSIMCRSSYFIGFI